MKTIGKWIVSCCIVLLAGGCDDDFLDNHEEQAIIEAETTLTLTTGTEHYEHTITIPGAGDAAYSVGLLPKWISFKYLKGSFKDNTVLLKFAVQEATTGTNESTLSLTVEGVGVYLQPVRIVSE